jgi:hypothetical protein
MGRALFLCGEPGAHAAATGGGAFSGGVDFSGVLIGFGIFELAAVVVAGIAVGTILLLVHFSSRSRGEVGPLS